MQVQRHLPSFHISHVQGGNPHNGHPRHDLATRGQNLFRLMQENGQISNEGYRELQQALQNAKQITNTYNQLCDEAIEGMRNPDEIMRTIEVFQNIISASVNACFLPVEYFIDLSGIIQERGVQAYRFMAEIDNQIKQAEWNRRQEEKLIDAAIEKERHEQRLKEINALNARDAAQDKRLVETYSRCVDTYLILMEEARNLVKENKRNKKREIRIDEKLPSIDFANRKIGEWHVRVVV